MVGSARSLVLVALLAAPALSPARDLFLEAEIEPTRVPVQTQAVYRLRLYQGVDLRDLKMDGPAAALADFRPIGEGRIYEALRDGRRYRVHERAYAVFPFASGPLEIAGAGASGRAPGDSGKSADGRREVRLEAPVRTLAVLPVPADVGMAARSLRLSETWEGDTDPRGGMALRRLIRIEAAGVDAGVLPEMAWEAPGLAVHPESPRLSSRFEGEINLAVREQAFRVVPQGGGKLVVPELRLSWWNAESETLATATLSARTLEVSGPEGVSARGMPAAADPAGGIPWLPIAGAAAALAALTAFLVAAWRGYGRARWQIGRACRSGRGDAVRDALLAWAADRWPESPPLTLLSLAERLADPVARRAAVELERRLYGPSGGGEGEVPLKALARRIRRG